MKKEEIKVIAILVIKVLSIIDIIVSSFWAVISFIVYLVKDIPFDWWSIWAFVIGFIVFIACFIYMAISSRRNTIKAKSETRNKPKRKSKFQERLQEMQEKRNN